MKPFQCCANGKNGNSGEEDDDKFTVDPVLLNSESGKRESLSMLRQLSSVQTPFVVGRNEATVNFSVLPTNQPKYPKEPAAVNPYQYFSRVVSMAPSPRQQESAESGLQWTESRKLLEAALMFEQVAPSIDPVLYYRQDLAAQEHRLVARLRSLGLDMAVQRGDGNCQFRSLSFGLFGTPNYHGNVRKTAVEYIKSRRSDFELFLGQDFKVYVREMAKDGQWGDELTLRAACEAYGVVVNVLTSENDNWFMRYIPEHTLVQKEVFLSYIAPVHYNAIVRMPRGAAPILRSMSSLGRRNSRVVAALDEYEKNKAVPQHPTEVLC